MLPKPGELPADESGVPTLNMSANVVSLFWKAVELEFATLLDITPKACIAVDIPDKIVPYILCTPINLKSAVDLQISCQLGE
jgi:hypothetical protein